MARGIVVVELEFNRLPEIRAALRPMASQVVRKTAFDVEAGAKERSRVDTGNMKNGWQTEMEGDLTAVVYNNVEYVIYHEFGTRKMSAQPMATPAAEEARPGFVAAMKELFE